MKPVSSVLLALAVAAAAVLSTGRVQAQDAFPSRILSVLLRNLHNAEFSANPNLLAFLRDAGMKPDLADILALGMSPTTMSPQDPTLSAKVLVEGECKAGTGINTECRLRFIQSGGDGSKLDEETESALVLIFRLDRPVTEDGARIVDPIRVDVAG